MSVAFRRESDDEHLEPKFDIPLPPGPNLVTARGLAIIRAKVAELEAAAAATTDAEALKAVRRDLKYWHTRETGAEIAPIPDEEEVAFGSRVTYRLAVFSSPHDPAGTDDHPVAAVGHWVHVYVDRESRRPVPIPAEIRTLLESIG